MLDLFPRSRPPDWTQNNDGITLLSPYYYTVSSSSIYSSFSSMFKAQGLSEGVQACGPDMPKTSNPSAPHRSVSFVKGCCRIPKAKTNSSNRIKAAVMAAPAKFPSRQGTKNRRKKLNKRRHKLAAWFFSCPPVPDHIYRWSERQLLKE